MYCVGRGEYVIFNSKTEKKSGRRVVDVVVVYHVTIWTWVVEEILAFLVEDCVLRTVDNTCHH